MQRLKAIKALGLEQGLLDLAASRFNSALEALS